MSERKRASAPPPTKKRKLSTPVPEEEDPEGSGSEDSDEELSDPEDIVDDEEDLLPVIPPKGVAVFNSVEQFLAALQKQRSFAPISPDETKSFPPPNKS